MTRTIAAAALALGACWTTPAVAPEVPIAKAKRCTIHDADVTTTGTATLSIKWLGCAHQTVPCTRLDVTFHDAVGRARVETDMVVIDGDIDRSALPLRPRELGWQDGWIEIRSATARAATQGLLKLGVDLPDGLTPKEALFSLPCDGLTFAVAPDPPDPPEAKGKPEEVALAIGTELHAVPGGPTIARVTGYLAPEALPNTARQPLNVIVLAKAKEMTQVRIEGTNPVIAWATTTKLKPAKGDQLGGFGFGRSGYGRHEYRCSRDVAIYVRIGARAIRVGRLKKDAGFYLSGDGDGEDDDVGIDLGLPSPGTTPFLKKSDFGHCG